MNIFIPQSIDSILKGGHSLFEFYKLTVLVLSFLFLPFLFPTSSAANPNYESIERYAASNSLARRYPEDYPPMDYDTGTMPRYGRGRSEKDREKFGTPLHDNPWYTTVKMERFEYRNPNEANDELLWDLQVRTGNDDHRFFLESEGHWSSGGSEPEAMNIDLLYSWPVAAFWDVHVGGRQLIFKDVSSRYFAVLGLRGLVPYWLETKFDILAGEKHDLRASLEIEHELLFTQRLILQSRLKTQLAASKQEELQLGSGFTDIEVGVRLRYEYSRKFTPYLGLSFESALGETADIIEDNDGTKHDRTFVAGLRFWF